MAPLKSVLLIDDNSSDNLIHSIWLERAGAVASRQDVIVRENGLEGIRFLKDWEHNRTALGERFPPMLILLDINMPVMNGFEFLDALTGLARERDLESIVLLMLTSSCAEQDRQRAQACPLVRGYIEKPLNRSTVEAMMRTYFG